MAEPPVEEEKRDEEDVPMGNTEMQEDGNEDGDGEGWGEGNEDGESGGWDNYGEEEDELDEVVMQAIEATKRKKELE